MTTPRVTEITPVLEELARSVTDRVRGMGEAQVVENVERLCSILSVAQRAYVVSRCVEAAREDDDLRALFSEPLPDLAVPASEWSSYPVESRLCMRAEYADSHAPSQEAGVRVCDVYSVLCAEGLL